MEDKMEQDIYYLVGQNIKKQRKLKKMTQLQLAEKSFFSYEFIRKIESKSSCRNTFSLDTVDKIAKVLDVDIRILFEPLDEWNTYEVNPPKKLPTIVDSFFVFL